MGHPSSKHTWDEASSPAAIGLARRFEADWRDSGHSAGRPDPDDYLDGDPSHNPGARLALLRADLGLRWESGERVRVEWYRDRYSDLSDETLVALIYEEFCLREEEHGDPDPSEYYGRFPSLESQLRRVFDIHGLVGSGATTALHLPDGSTVSFPESGQTIAGFYLVEELGRGSFARVFRAEERQLADRPVALKVARNGSREPQTLARLQHTHIVPVHSYRSDPATGLHLLCMPYFGRVTLARLLDDPRVKIARNGAEILAALDALDPTEARRAKTKPKGLCSDRQATADRRAIAGLPYARAIAWWGARLAEALNHAHDRGVLHRDIKPSNVLVTADGMPMLLDFNLAQASLAGPDDLEAEALGGTIAYMAPEHLESLADGEPGRVDARADVYSLGVVLFEAMGTRPFPARPGPKARSVFEALNRAAEERRLEIPRLRDLHPEAPPAFEAVVRKCLAPDPADRYPNAAALAADLQAVAEDEPLQWAREPLPSQARRWARRNRRRLAVAVPLLLAFAATLYAGFQSKVAEVHLRHEVLTSIGEGKHAEHEGRYDLALSHFRAAARLAEGTRGLDDLHRLARDRLGNAEEARKVSADAERLFKAAEPLRFALLGFGHDDEGDEIETLQAALRPFYVLEHPTDWTQRDELTFLDEDLRRRLITEVEELLFFWAVTAAADPSDSGSSRSEALKICDRALTFARTKSPWQALRERCQASLDRRAPRLDLEPEPRAENSAWACFQRALIHSMVDRDGLSKAIAWLERSVRLDPSHYWAQYYLAYYYDHAGKADLALGHYNTAIALRPDSPFALFSRAQLYWRRGSWDRAMDDLDRALALSDGRHFDEARLEQGIVRLRLGDFTGARRDFEAVLASAGPDGPFGRAARLNLAALELESGHVDQARSIYDALLSQAVPGSEDLPSVRLGRATLALRASLSEQAEAELTGLLESEPLQPEYLSLRALCRLAMHRTRQAEADARRALELDPSSPSRERLWIRARLASGLVEGLRIDRPSTLAKLPGDLKSLTADLRAAAQALEPRRDDPVALTTRAVILAALGDRSAEAVASRAIDLEPQSPRARLTRARVRYSLGSRAGAEADVEAGLAIDPDDPDLNELRGVLAFEAGDPKSALTDLDRAIQHGGTPTTHRRRAEVLLALGRVQEALEAWSEQLRSDPDDPTAYLGRSLAARRLGLWDQALADLEAAAAESADRPRLLARVVASYALCLPARPNRLGRVLSLARRTAEVLTREGWSFAAQSPEYLRSLLTWVPPR